ncbi:hypothetical protein B0H15DRAFT_295783 [Mycena belliarum]|uniref:Uncharacterized protein n=1 Tax=Mycena belliarum TaxID=1033014 RepID=A0AAD6U4D4_9AGAR|nr:hypothetical protein B0H15DRAFT_295783 [Mycena belliae]
MYVNALCSLFVTTLRRSITLCIGCLERAHPGISASSVAQTMVHVGSRSLITFGPPESKNRMARRCPAARWPWHLFSLKFLLT